MTPSGFACNPRNLLNRDRGPSDRKARWLLAFSIALLAGTSAVIAATPLRIAAPEELEAFVGKWTAMFEGHPFFRMQITPGGGTIANFGFLVDAGGNLVDGGERKGSARITEAHVEGSVLHIVADETVTTSESRRPQRLTLDLKLTGGDRGAIQLSDPRVKSWEVQRH